MDDLVFWRPFLLDSLLFHVLFSILVTFLLDSLLFMYDLVFLQLLLLNLLFSSVFLYMIKHTKRDVTHALFLLPSVTYCPTFSDVLPLQVTYFMDDPFSHLSSFAHSYRSHGKWLAPFWITPYIPRPYPVGWCTDSDHVILGGVTEVVLTASLTFGKLIWLIDWFCRLMIAVG